MLSQVYLAYCGVEGHGEKIPQGSTYGFKEPDVAAAATITDGHHADDSLKDYMVVRVPIDAPEAEGSEEEGDEEDDEDDEDEDEEEEEGDKEPAVVEYMELPMTVLHISGLEGGLEDEEQ